MQKTYNPQHTEAALVHKHKVYKPQLLELAKQSDEYKHRKFLKDIDDKIRHYKTCLYLDRVFKINTVQVI